MGYTHYWEGLDACDVEWNAFLDDVRAILASEGDLVCFEEDEPDKPPQVDMEAVRFNGKGLAGHETFYIAPRDKGPNFCKTARKPYDSVVCAVLIAAHEQLGLEVSSDGTWSENWQPGAGLYEGATGRKVVNILEEW